MALAQATAQTGALVDGASPGHVAAGHGQPAVRQRCAEVVPRRPQSAGNGIAAAREAGFLHAADSETASPAPIASSSCAEFQLHETSMGDVLIDNEDAQVSP